MTAASVSGCPDHLVGQPATTRQPLVGKKARPMIQMIPLEHVRDVLRAPVLEFDGDLFVVVAAAWTPEELKECDWHNEAFGHRLIRIDETGRGRPLEGCPIYDAFGLSVLVNRKGAPSS